MPSERNDIALSTALDTARAAGKLLLGYFGHAESQQKQGARNIVTQADLAAEELISRELLAAFPQHELLREETAFHGDLLAEHLWIVDPLDGTTNFAHGIPHFCVSIAYACRGEVQVGVVYDPLRDEMFSARRGHGSELNGQAIRVSQPPGLDHAVVATGFYYDRGPMMERTLETVRTLFRANIRGIRRMGAAALDLSWVGCGRFQGFFEYELAPWDYAAGGLIVSEAGGECWERSGRPLRLDSRSVVAACPAIGDELLELVVWR